LASLPVRDVGKNTSSTSPTVCSCSRSRPDDAKYISSFISDGKLGDGGQRFQSLLTVVVTSTTLPRIRPGDSLAGRLGSLGAGGFHSRTAAPPGGGCLAPGSFSRPGMRTGVKPRTRRGLTPAAGAAGIIKGGERGSRRRARAVSARDGLSGGAPAAARGSAERG